MELVAPSSLLLAAPISNEMAPFAIPCTLHIPRCMTDGQFTPPPSPSDTDKYPTIVRLVHRDSNVRCSRRLTHPPQPEPRCGTAQELDHNEISDVMQSFNFETETRTPQLDAPPSSPFDDERRSTDCSSRPQLELRRRLDSYCNLRGLAQEHTNDNQTGLSRTPPTASPLLPSPIPDNRTMEPYGYLTNALNFENPRSVAHQRKESNYKSYDDMQILSCYQDDHRMSEDTARSLPRKGHLLAYSMPTGSADHVPAFDGTFAEAYYNTTTQHSSTESKWLANTTSQEQRLRKFRARCYRVIQQPVQPSPSEDVNEGKIMLATVLVGPGKPKLVQIQRSQSFASSVQNRQAPSCTSLPSVQESNDYVDVAPSTPVFQRKEVSAFSPYDTPSVKTPFTDMSLPRRDRVRSPIEQTPLTASKLDLVPQPLALPRRNSSDSDESMDSTTEQRLRAFGKNFSFSPTDAVNNISLTRSTTATTFLTDDLLDLEDDHGKLFSILHKRNQLEQKLDAITSAIDEFPNYIVTLESSLLSSIRDSPSKSKDIVHISNLSKVFAAAPKPLLEAIAAWIIVDSYVSNLHLDQYNLSLQTQTLQSTDPAPMPRIPTRSVSLAFSRLYSKSKYESTYNLFPLPPKTKSFHRRSDSEISSDLALQSTDSLHSIPSKARLLLGLDHQQQQHYRTYSDEQFIITRAKALSISVGVISQKLIEVLKDQGGWDPYLWKALVVMVNAVESSDI